MSSLRKAALVCAAFGYLAAGCAGTEPFGGSRQRVEAWAASQGFAPETIEVGGFGLFSLRRGRAAVLAVYIEGDGAPWPNIYQPPRDPTPIRPVALALAARDPVPAVAYLGRPCQYLDDDRRTHCGVDWWSSRRFAPEVLEAMDAALSRLRQRAGAQRLRLVGYSGGGVIAALLAMRRDDVAALVTVAAPLSLEDWTRLHDLSPLEGAPDPLAQHTARPVDATHFAGGRDEVVPPAIVGDFVRRRGGRLETIPDFDHDCCWVRDWPQLLQRTRKEAP